MAINDIFQAIRDERLHSLITRLMYEPKTADVLKLDEKYSKELTKLVMKGANVGQVTGGELDNKTILQVLVERGFDLTTSKCFEALRGTNCDFTEALFHVNKPGQVSALVSAGADVNCRMSQTVRDCRKDVDCLPAIYYAYQNACNLRNNNVHIYMGIVREFIDNGADVNATETHYYGSFGFRPYEVSLLNCVEMEDSLDRYSGARNECKKLCTELLLKRGANPNTNTTLFYQDKSFTPLFTFVPMVEKYACLNNIEMIDLFVKYGADIPEQFICERTDRDMTDETREHLDNIKTSQDPIA